MTSDPLDVAIAAARNAGDLLMQRHDPGHVSEKGRRGDLVTDADRAAEAEILTRLQRSFPNAAVLAEEGGARSGTSGERWIVDPLDGTTNFAHGYPLYCVSIAYERDGELFAGVIYAPVLGECFTARRGEGARLNGQPIHVSAIERLGDAMVCTGFQPSDYLRNGKWFAAMSDAAQAVRRDGSAALDLAFVACGRFDGFWEFDLKPWDVAAGTLIVREAGGTISQTTGDDAQLDAPSILATNSRTHQEMTRVFQ
ncbi:MAG TPA: inositol monophosphatase family protein [Candidatus Tumulicola sp.]|jgi:myo-inositol-1(or 4)-monophosphatase